MSTYPRGLERTQIHLAVDRASKRYEGERKSFFVPFLSITYFIFNGEAQEELSNGEKRELGKKEV